MKQPLALLVLWLAFASCNAQEQKQDQPAEASGGIHWMSFEEAVARHDKAPKKLFIDVYTQWCGWCKRMDKTTFTDPKVVAEINAHFYAVKLDAERKDSVPFRGQVFVYKPEYKSHELALALLNGQMSYPTYVFLDESFGMISPVAGYKTPEQLLPLLDYFASDTYKTKKWEEYQAEHPGADK